MIFRLDFGRIVNETGWRSSWRPKENGNLPLAIWAPVSTFFATLVAQKHKLSEF